MAGIVLGCIVPHPPLLVPEVGGGAEARVAATTEAMRNLAGKLAAKRPETVFVISPHGASHRDAMGVATAKRLWGSMRNWGASSVDHSFQSDPDAIAALEEEARASGISLKSIGEREYSLDHGVMVPMYFLVEVLGNVPLVPLTFCWLPLARHFAFGQAIGRAAERLGKRTAVVASGDLSHRLIPSAPAGYDPMGEVFDRKLVQAVAALDTQGILALDEELIERAGECGLRSIVILLGALDGLAVRPEVLSYEGPFGVGYLVASFEVEEEADGGMHPLVLLAKRAVESYVRDKKTLQPGELTPKMREKAGVFVSLKVHGELRGCIGTFEPTKSNIAEEIVANAMSSATRDPRFMPVAPDELADLSYSVDVLTMPEPVEGEAQLDPQRYGVIVEAGGRRGLLLPDLEGVESIEQQVSICRQKAGIRPNEPVKLHRFEVKRYK